LLICFQVGDVLSTINSIIGFTVVLLHRQRIVVIRRVFLIGAIMYGLRAVVLSVTFMPPRFVRFLNDQLQLLFLVLTIGKKSVYLSRIALVM
jgi:hypothetical protein